MPPLAHDGRRLKRALRVRQDGAGPRRRRRREGGGHNTIVLRRSQKWGSIGGRGGGGSRCQTKRDCAPGCRIESGCPRCGARERRVHVKAGDSTVRDKREAEESGTRESVPATAHPLPRPGPEAREGNPARTVAQRWAATAARQGSPATRRRIAGGGTQAACGSETTVVARAKIHRAGPNSGGDEITRPGS